ncbi:MAG: hypothetical protein NWE99_10975 [Candidatus Bathyarchaeota archaeon]|nr:hypothetical protein [Candidatus Bathyarchaeota archaeon]
MKKLARLLFTIGVITIFLAVINYIDAVNTIANMPGGTGLRDYIASQAAVGFLLWLGVGITEVTVAYIYNEKT